MAFGLDIAKIIKYDLFGLGKHTLKTEHISLLRRIINIPTNGETAFHCELQYLFGCTYHNFCSFNNFTAVDV